MSHFCSLLIVAAVAPGAAAAWTLDETPAVAGEWGFRPAEGVASPVNPPGFVWRPQKNALHYELQIAADPAFARIEYESGPLTLACHCPPRALPPGTYHWRFRGIDKNGNASQWSRVRSFQLSADAVEFPLPPLDELIRRVPAGHPRLFVRPEDLPRLRELARGSMAPQYAALKKQCDALLRQPPPTAEPPKYPKGMERKSEAWREMWWGNRLYTIKVLDSAATLAFTRLLDGNEEYGALAKRLLLDAARWDPKGATGYRYNDEAGMPYAYFFSRAYTFLYDALSEEEREQCRSVMRIRGQEMYEHLCPSHIWRPYSSHSNRAWHFLGEVALAFQGEIPESRDWLWFAMNVFYCAYPVWCDDDGGWHEGMAYWRSYIGRFTWWADIMRSALAIDAYRKPYFSQIGYYPMYVQPPGTYGGGFGDLCGRLDSKGNVPLLQIFAAQAQNPYWQWYVEAHGRPPVQTGYVGFIRGAMKSPSAKVPDDLPSSRCFAGIGLAALNSNLLDAKNNVAVLFKSSPFGTQSHGYDANNAFLLTAFGRPVFISSGWRDIYGSDHHTNWMWHTKSTNCITVNGQSQTKHSPAAVGRIEAFHTSPAMDFVSGEAGYAYDGALKQFTRSVLFVKPQLIVIFDELDSEKPSTFEWWLHAPAPMELLSGQRARVTVEDVQCDVAFLEPAGLKITHTDQFDPPPRPRVQLTEYHLTASTPVPSQKCRFVTILRPRRAGEPAIDGQRASSVDEGVTVEAELGGGRKMAAFLRIDGRTASKAKLGDLATAGRLKAIVTDAAGRVIDQLEVK